MAFDLILGAGVHDALGHIGEGEGLAESQAEARRRVGAFRHAAEDFADRGGERRAGDAHDRTASR